MRRAQIAVLILAVGAGGVAAMLATRSEQPAAAPAPAPLPVVATVDVLVAKADIEVGRRLSADDVQWQAWPASSANALFMRRTDNPGAAAQVAGSIARSAFTGGEPIREAKLIRANGSGFMAALIRSGMRAISTDISPEAGVGGFILPNDHVDLILLDQLGGLLCPHAVGRFAVLEVQLQLSPEQPAVCIDVVDHHPGDVGIGDPHERERARVIRYDANLDGAG